MDLMPSTPPSSRPTPTATRAARSRRTSDQAPALAITFAAASDTGNFREHNEDTAFTVSLEAARNMDGARAAILGVCDGMGGVHGGHIASALTRDLLVKSLTADPATTPAALSEAIEEASRHVYEMGERRRELRGMGTTATVATIDGDTMLVGQVGDSRCYLLRGGRLRQLTRDQSLVALLVERGELTEEEARHSPYSNVILQAVGTSESIAPVVQRVALEPGDVVMLCSDGLHGVLEPRALSRLLKAVEPGAEGETCEALIAAALEAGSTDNVSCVIACVRSA
ncbi:MAG: protein phosphatase 2C domain-containing protein [Polyangiaceae bacterium]